jgi:guanylate kinase
MKRRKKFLGRPCLSAGRLFVISGPSGCGKTTLCEELLKKSPGLLRSVSCTTRPRRKGEKEGTDYFYSTVPQFEKGIEQKRFLEHARVFGNYYGTPKKFVLAKLKRGRNVILNIDVQGAAQIKRAFKEAVLIFIMPPAMKELKKRLVRRSSEDRKEIRKRLRVARREMGAKGAYDFLVVNDKVETAVQELIDITNGVNKKTLNRRK